MRTRYPAACGGELHCLEEFKSVEQLSGKDTIELFNRHGVVDYIRAYYEALHTTGRQYIVNDINLYIKARQPS